MLTFIRFSLTLIFMAGISQISIAQDSWKKLASDADKLFKEGKFAEAGDNYFKAWKLKDKKTELAAKAGDCYYIIKDYKKAVKAYKPVKDMNSEFKHIGFKYARCLKSLEEYDEASREFVYFINSYSGDDYQDMSQLTQSEILGCEYAIKNADKEAEGVIINHIGENINTQEMEYAPLPYSDDILYFSSDVSGTSKIYRSQKIDGAWTKSQSTEKIFANVTREHYGNVSFAPDNSRFYFTQCDATNSYNSRCDLYVVESNDDGSWSEPRILPDYVNDLEATNTQPCVVHTDDLEIIYFASDRSGGKGGLDLWYVSRSIDSKNMDYTFPKNLGSRVNTVGDEITPFYDRESNTLFFSSDGHIGFGGFDIFKVQGSQFDWDKPTNLGKPYNSSSDERYFIYKESMENGFFVSNRIADLSKLSTTHEDIFEFEEEFTEITIKGSIKDKEGKGVEGVEIFLYEIASNGQKRVIANQTGDGKYQFPLIENKSYALEAKKEGYSAYNLEFEIPSPGVSIDKDLEMVKKGTGATASVGTTPPKPIKPNPSFLDPPKKEDPVVVSPPTTSPPSIVEPPVVTTTPPSTTVEPDPVVVSPPTTTPPSTVEPPVVTTTPPSTTVEPDPVVVSPPTTTPPSTVEPPVVTTTPPSTTVEPDPVVVSPPTTTPPSTVEPPVVTPETKLPPANDPYWYPNTSGSGSNPSTTTTTPSSSDPVYLDNTVHSSGTYYKVQIEAMRTFVKSKYSEVESIGRIETEYIHEKDLVRIMLGNYYNKEDAIAARNEARDKGYTRAYTVKYVDGVRKGIKVFYNE